MLKSLVASASALLAVEIVENRKPESNGELIGIIRSGGPKVQGKVAFFQGNPKVTLGNFAFIDALPGEFAEKRFAKVELIGNRDFGNRLDDARAAAFTALKTTPIDIQPQVELDEDQTHLLALFEQANHSDQSIEALIAEAFTLEENVELPAGLEIVHPVLDPSAPNRDFRLIKAPREQALVAVRDWCQHRVYGVLGVAGDSNETIVAIAKR